MQREQVSVRKRVEVMEEGLLSRMVRRLDVEVKKERRW